MNWKTFIPPACGAAGLAGTAIASHEFAVMTGPETTATLGDQAVHIGLPVLLTIAASVVRWVMAAHSAIFRPASSPVSEAEQIASNLLNARLKNRDFEGAKRALAEVQAEVKS